MRWVIEARWHGPTKTLIAYREVTRSKRRAESVRGTVVLFSDGTRMPFSVREARHREKVEELPGYSLLLLDIERAGRLGTVVDVRDLS